MNRGMDVCVSFRKTYNAILNFCASNTVTAAVFGALPPVYILSYMIYNTTQHTPFAYASYMTGSGFSIFGILAAGWLLACLSLWKTMPNLLSLTIFLYKCLGHWAFVSFVIVLFYFTQYAGFKVTGYLAAGLLPPIVLLLFAADVLRARRTKMYAALAAPTPAPAPVPPEVIHVEL